ncbi:MAG: DUF4097 family beta strand repeat-containing protein [Microbacteriaceae bacterium]
MSLEKWLIKPGETTVIDLEIVRKLKVGLIRGQVDIIGHDEPGARVEVHSVAGKELKVSMDGDTLEIDHPQLRWDNFIEVFSSFRGSARADVSVLVPRDVALKFGVVSSTGLISGLHADAKISTVSGDVVIDKMVGDLDLNAVNGELSVRDQVGRINAHTISGDITASGAIEKFSADSVSADIFLDATGSPDQISTNTVSGNTTIRLSEGLGARFNINTVSGRLQLDDKYITGVRGKGYNATSGSLHGSWVEVRCNSVSGNVSVVRRAAETHSEEASA